MRGAGSTPISFNTVNGKHCCNTKWLDVDKDLAGFNTVNGKHCCNDLKQIK